MTDAAPGMPASGGTFAAGVLLAGQRAWVADREPLKAIQKGRRTGITWAEAFDDVTIAASTRGAGGMNVYYLPPAKEDAIEYIEVCAKWAKALHYAVGEVGELVEAGTWADDGGVFSSENPDKDIQTYRIRFASGFRIVALSSSPRRLRGKQGVIVFDEAAFHDDLPGILKSAIALFLRGGKLRLISTHNGDDSPFNELIREIQAGKRKGAVHRYPFRQAIADGMYRRICELEDRPWSEADEARYLADAYAYYGDDAAEELDAVPAQGSGTYLPMVLIHARTDPDTPVLRGAWDLAFGHVDEPVRRLEIEAWCHEHLAPVLRGLDAARPHGIGVDFARVGDLTVMTVAEEGQDLVLRERFSVELARCPLRQQEQVLDYIVESLPGFRAGAYDAGGNGMALAEYAVDHWGIERSAQIQLSERFYLEFFALFKAALQDGTYTGLPRDAEVRDDLRAIKVVRGVPRVPAAKTQTGDAKQGRQQRHGDAAVSRLLLHYAMTQMEGAPIEFESAGPRGGARLFGAPEEAYGAAGWGTVRGGRRP